jgi:NAD(P)H-dependent FMN reductase
MKYKLHVIVGSTRPGRKGSAIARWFYSFAADHGKFDPVFIDLADFNLPVFDEPNHPAMQQYVHPHTIAWAKSVEMADAFVFVTPEYNSGPPPSLLNALNYLYKEWAYKPAGFVSYGGIAGGVRAVQMLKQTLTTLKMMPMAEAVIAPMFQEFIDDNGRFVPNAMHSQSARETLDELYRWTNALAPLRLHATSHGKSEAEEVSHE